MPGIKEHELAMEVKVKELELAAAATQIIANRHSDVSMHVCFIPLSKELQLISTSFSLRDREWLIEVQTLLLQIVLLVRHGQLILFLHRTPHHSVLYLNHTIT